MKRVRSPQNSVRYILAPTLIRGDFKDAIKYLNKLVKSGDAWKFNYRQLKSILSRTLTQADYALAVKYLNIIVRPYRKKDSQ